MLVPLTNSAKFAIVDDSFQEEVECQKWSLTSHGYVNSTTPSGFPEYGRIYLHQLIMGEKPGFQIDHINGDRLDNRTANLRHVTRSQQNMNSGIRSNNTTGRKGVCLNPEGNWSVFINCKYFGRYPTFEEACQAREKAEQQLHGEYARKESVAISTSKEKDVKLSA